MKPVTKNQKRVVELMARLPLITDAQKKFAKSNFSFHATSYKKTRYCLECGSQWKTQENAIFDQMLGTKCPNQECASYGKELIMYQHNGDTEHYLNTLIVQTIEDYQVVRVLSTNKATKKRREALYTHTEVIQYWIRIDGKIEVVSKDCFSLYGYERWGYKPLEIKKNNLFKSGYSGNRHSYLVHYDNVYPRQKIHPLFKRNGYLPLFSNKIHPTRTFYYLTKSNLLETLLKTNQYNLAKYFLLSDCNSDFTNEMMTCIKNNYIVNEVDIWIDTMKFMRFFGKDLKNKKYCCPENLKEVHDRLLYKKQMHEKKKELEKKKKTINEFNPKYKFDKKNFLGMSFSHGSIHLEVLNSVNDFLEDATKLSHCLFENEYYQRKNSLILRAVNNGELKENVEILLSDLSINQSRGLNNTYSDCHNEIIEATKLFIPKIRNAAISKKKKNGIKKTA